MQLHMDAVDNAIVAFEMAGWANVNSIFIQDSSEPGHELFACQAVVLLYVPENNRTFDSSLTIGRKNTSSRALIEQTKTFQC